MDDRRSQLLDVAVREQLYAYGLVLPPWRAYPEIERFSTGSLISLVETAPG